MIPTSWIYSLRKEELIHYLEEFSLETTGTCEELRRRFAQFVTKPDVESIDRLEQLADKHKRFVSPSRQSEGQNDIKATIGEESAAHRWPDPCGNTTNATTTTISSTNAPQTRPDAVNNVTTTLVTTINNVYTTCTLSSYGLRVPTYTTSTTLGGSFYSTAIPAQTSTPRISTYCPATNVMTQVNTFTPHISETELPFRTTDLTTLMDRIRKWAIRYSGGNGALAFIERLEEMAGAYGIDLSLMPRILTELLQGQALIWYRCNKKPWGSWQGFKREFLDFFLPPNYFDHLEDTVRERKQGAKELFKEYVIALQDLMHHVQFTDAQKLERIYKNSRQEYQLNIKRKEFDNLAELLTLAGDYETKMSYSNTQNIRTSHERNRQVATTTDDTRPINTRQACWKCGQLGHSKRQCRNPQQLFCWECGKQTGKWRRCPNTGPREHQNVGALVRIGELGQEGNNLYITLLFDKMTKRATIDTGATRSFINENFAQQISQYVKPTTLDITIYLANGHNYEVTKGFEMQLHFGNLDQPLTFILMPGSTDDIVVGMDFLSMTNSHLKCAGQELKITTGKRANEFVSLSSVKEGKTYSEDISERLQIQSFLEEELPRFNNLRGTTHHGKHRITMKDENPVKQRYTPRNPAMLDIINKEIDELINKGCIEPSRSPHSSPIVLVKKKNGTWRLCIDFRQINAKSIPDAYPLPRIQSILDRLRGAKYISTLDLKNGYWQVPMEHQSKQYTAFTVPGRGLFQWRVMPFGLHSAPATFQRILDRVIGPELEPFAFAYLDDIVVIGRSLEEHRQNLGTVFRRLQEANLRINPEKCEFFKNELRYLGHVVSQQGIHTDPEKIAAVKELRSPSNIRELRRCLGIASWYRRFVPEFAEIVRPMTDLLKKGKHWHWKKEQEAAFVDLKKRLTEAPILACPDFTQQFTLQTDASDYGLGAVLTQNLDGVERVIAYASRHLNSAEINYSPTEKECLAIVWGIRKMRQYVEGYRFKVITDHLSLKWLDSIESPSGRIARWALELQQYSFDIEYRRGKLNVVADALSRQPRETYQQVTEIETCPWIKHKIETVLTNPELNPDFSIVNGRLYRHLGTEDQGGSPAWKLCVPKHQRQRVLDETHSSLTAGHLGIRKTIARVCNKYYWPGMIRDIRSFVRSCDSCQRYKVSQQLPAGEMLIKIAKAPGEVFCADFVGPLPRSKHGNSMLLVFIDKFTKWVELIPLRQATGDTLQKAFRERILARFGTPKMLICDNGTQFTSKKFQNFLENLGVHQQFTAPYAPHENPTERANRTIKTIISQVTKDVHNKWDEHLAEISLAINTSKSESTGYSPAYLTQGREFRLPRELYSEENLGSGRQEMTPEEKGNEMREIFHLVHRNLQKAAREQSRHYNLRRRKWQPRVGDLVLIKYRPLSKATDNFAAKLAPRFHGPFQVWNFKSPVIIEVKDPNTRQLRTAHLGDVKAYVQENNLTTEPQEV